MKRFKLWNHYQYEISTKKFKALHLITLNIVLITYTYQFLKHWWLEFKDCENAFELYFKTTNHFGNKKEDKKCLLETEH